jgi:hypothetical protein
MEKCQVYENFNIKASFETIFLSYAKNPILGIFLTHSMTLLDRTWSEKCNGVCFRAIRHTQCSLGQCENRSRTFCPPCIRRKRFVVSRPDATLLVITK